MTRYTYGPDAIAADDLRGLATRELKRFDSIVRRGGGGRNAAASNEAAAGRFEQALRYVLAIEDSEGVEAAAKLSDRLTILRQRAQACGLLSPADVIAIEGRVIT